MPGSSCQTTAPVGQRVTAPSVQNGASPSHSPDDSPDESSADLFVSLLATPPIAVLPTAAPPIAETLDHPRAAAPTLKRIPKGARADASRVLQGLLRDITRDTENTETWIRLFKFAPACLKQPGHGGKSRNLTTAVKKQIQAFSDRHPRQGIDEQPRQRTRKQNNKDMDEELEVARRAVAKLGEGDVRGALRVLSSKDTLAPRNNTTMASLLALHPPMPTDRRAPPALSAAAVQVTQAEVKEAITSFPNGSAAGPDGLRPQHLKDLIAGGEGSETLLEAITEFINIVLAGRTPATVCPLLFGGALTAILKRGGGVRPIAVGYTWRRLAGKVAGRRVGPRAAALLAPKQLGFAVPGGAEAAVHAARRYVSGLPQGHVLVKVDFANAFNTIRRDVVLEAVARFLPELLPYTRSAYSARSNLSFGEYTVPSEEGVQQGDPLGPLLFCLAIHDLLGSMRSEVTIGYLDDGTLGGEASVVLDDFMRLEVEAGRLGLKLNRAKCEVAGHTAESRQLFAAQGLSLTETDLDTLTLLGSPLLPGEGIDDTLSTKREELATLASRLPLLTSHDSLFLLRSVVSTPRLLYTLRTAPCTGSAELERYDELLRTTLTVTLNVNMTDVGWSQASLPIRWGGLGVRSAVSLAAPAYLASAASTADLVLRVLPPHLHQSTDASIDVALLAWQAAVASSTTRPLGPRAKVQRAWDEPCCAKVASTLLEGAMDDHARARLRASQQATSGAWLKALPLATVGLRLENETVRTAVGLRLGLTLCRPHTCPCGVQVDAMGTHGLACKKSVGRHPRHSLLNDVIWRAMQRAQIPSAKEPTGLIPSSDLRPDGVSMLPWARGRCLAWDVTAPDTLAQSHVQATAVNAGAAAAKAEATKVAKYAAIATTHLFIPLAFETLGAWGEQAKTFVAQLGRRITEVTGDVRETDFLRQRLSIAIQRGNALSVRGTLGPSPVTDVDADEA